MDRKALSQRPPGENRAGKAVMVGLTALVVAAILGPMVAQPETRQLGEVALRVGVAAPWALLGFLSARSNAGTQVDLNI